MEITYTEWVEHVFDHPVPQVDDATKQAHYQKIQEISLRIADGETTYQEMADELAPPDWVEWYFHYDAPYLDPTPKQTVQFITQAFTEIDLIARSYSDAQMAQGLNYILSNACSDYMLVLLDSSVALEDRKNAVASFVHVFDKLYANRCSNTPENEDTPEANPLDMTCYMWWDIIPFYAKSGIVDNNALDQPMLDVMTHTLQLDNYMCQKGSLHGLGHWKLDYPEQIEATIDNFLTRSNLQEAIIQYAKQARTGNIL